MRLIKEHSWYNIMVYLLTIMWTRIQSLSLIELFFWHHCMCYLGYYQRKRRLTGQLLKNIRVVNYAEFLSHTLMDLGSILSFNRVFNIPIPLIIYTILQIWNKGNRYNKNNERSLPRHELNSRPWDVNLTLRPLIHKNSVMKGKWYSWNGIIIMITNKFLWNRWEETGFEKRGKKNVVAPLSFLYFTLFFCLGAQNP